MSDIERIAYPLWRFEMYLSGFGTYEDIDWAVGRGLLRPYKKPGRIRTKIVKWAIERRKRSREKDYE